MKDDALALVAFSLVLGAVLIGICLGAIGAAHGQHSHPWLLEWIPTYCCVTNDCCFEIAERDVTALPNDQFRIVASGQVIPRTGYSPDGRWYRCACDNIDGKWTVHAKANTRCLFVPAMGS